MNFQPYKVTFNFQPSFKDGVDVTVSRFDIDGNDTVIVKYGRQATTEHIVEALSTSADLRDFKVSLVPNPDTGQ